MRVTTETSFLIKKMIFYFDKSVKLNGNILKINIKLKFNLIKIIVLKI